MAYKMTLVKQDLVQQEECRKDARRGEPPGDKKKLNAQSEPCVYLETIYSFMQIYVCDKPVMAIFDRGQILEKMARDNKKLPIVNNSLLYFVVQIISSWINVDTAHMQIVELAKQGGLQLHVLFQNRVHDMN